MSADATGAARRPPLVLLGLAAGPLVSMVDSSAVNVAVPEVAAELAAPLAAAGWIVSAYLLGIAACLPACAWLARRFGTRRVYATALVAFGAASALCGLAPGIEALIALRAVQGLASAPLVPLALALLFGDEPGRRGGAKMRPPMAAALMFFLAPALGPTVGGLLMAAGGWRLIFLINVPLIALGLLGVRRLPADPPADPGRARLDLPGLALLTLGATAAVHGAAELTSGGEARWGPAAAAVGLVLLGCYAGYARRAPHPALDLGLLRDGRARTAVLVSLIASVVLFGVLFLIPIHLLTVQGLSPVAAGLVLLPQGLAMGLCTGLGERLVERHGARATVAGGMLTLAAMTALLLPVTPQTPPWLLALLLCGRGLALGLTLQPIIAGIMTGGVARDLADAGTLFNVVQRVGGSLGVAGIAAFYQARADTGRPFHDTVWLLVALAAAGLLLVPFLGAKAVAAPEERADAPGTAPEGTPEKAPVPRPRPAVMR